MRFESRSATRRISWATQAGSVRSAAMRARTIGSSSASDTPGGNSAAERPSVECIGSSCGAAASRAFARAVHVKQRGGLLADELPIKLIDRTRARRADVRFVRRGKLVRRRLHTDAIRARSIQSRSAVRQPVIRPSDGRGEEKQGSERKHETSMAGYPHFMSAVQEHVSSVHEHVSVSRWDSAYIVVGDLAEP